MERSELCRAGEATLFAEAVTSDTRLAGVPEKEPLCAPAFASPVVMSLGARMLCDWNRLEVCPIA